MSLYLLIVLATLSWGIWGFTGKLSTQLNPPLFVNLFTSILYGILSVTLLIPLRVENSTINWGLAAIGWMTVNAIMGVAARSFFFIALAKSPASQVVAATATYPIVTAILAMYFFKERLTLSQGVGMVLTVIGIYLLLVKR